MSNDAYAYSSGALSCAMRVQDKIKVTEEQGIRANENTVTKVKMKELSVRGTSMGPIKTLTPAQAHRAAVHRTVLSRAGASTQHSQFLTWKDLH